MCLFDMDEYSKYCLSHFGVKTDEYYDYEFKGFAEILKYEQLLGRWWEEENENRVKEGGR